MNRALQWLAAPGWQTAHGPHIAPDTPGEERENYGQVVLGQRMRNALGRLNPHLPDSALDDALRRLTQPEGATLEARNRSFHRMLVAGVTVEYRAPDGNIRGEQVQVIDFDHPHDNDWLAVNQFTVSETAQGNRNTRRPDIVLLLNGLPLGVIELKNPADKDANTRAVFGDYISIYDIQRSVEDRATVPIHYESRLARLELDDAERPAIDPDFEEATEGEEIEHKERLKNKWAQLEAIVGSENRVGQIAEDIVGHFAQRLEALDGKAMVVCMSRRICVDLYSELVRLRPDWHDDDDAKGSIKVVMTGSASNPPEWQQHVRNKTRREMLAKRFRDSEILSA